MSNQELKVFCVEIELDPIGIIFKHFVAKTSTEAFDKAKEYLDKKGLSAIRISCTILSILDGYQIELKQIEE